MISLITFGYPSRLWLLVVPAILLIGYVLITWKKRSTPSSLAKRIRAVLPNNRPWIRHLAVLCALGSAVVLVIASAKPLGTVQRPRERATVVVAMDVSRSMMAQDVQPSRIVAAKEAAKSFIDSLPTGFNVSLVSFSGSAAMISPPTLDHSAVKRAIESLTLAPSTAIGEGIYTSLEALQLAPSDPDHPGETPPAAVVLISDGYTNIGRDSYQAALEAKAQNVPVYTIAYGTASGFVEEDGKRVPVPVNHQELKGIARASGGKKYSAKSLQDLTEVYQSLSKDIGYETVEADITQRYAFYAMICAALAACGAVSLAARWP